LKRQCDRTLDDYRADTDFKGGDLEGSGGGTFASDQTACCQRCHENEDCKGFSFVEGNNACWLKDEGYATNDKPGVVSAKMSSWRAGPKQAAGAKKEIPPPPPPAVPPPAATGLGDPEPPPPPPPVSLRASFCSPAASPRPPYIRYRSDAARRPGLTNGRRVQAVGIYAATPSSPPAFHRESKDKVKIDKVHPIAKGLGEETNLPSSRGTP
jgi:hypothetical protein